jgi:hypothetical protein
MKSRNKTLIVLAALAIAAPVGANQVYETDDANCPAVVTTPKENQLMYESRIVPSESATEPDTVSAPQQGFSAMPRQLQIMSDAGGISVPQTAPDADTLRPSDLAITASPRQLDQFDTIGMPLQSDTTQ